MTSRIGKPDTDADLQLQSCLSGQILTSFVMVAGAGSGKTTSLVKALSYIVKTRGQELKQRGQRVACITYTEVAEKEIWADVGNDPLIHVATIHSFLWSFIKPFQENISAWVATRMNEKIVDLEKKIDSPRTRPATRERAKRDIARLQEQLENLTRVPRFTYGAGSDYRNGILGHDDIIKMVPALVCRYPLLKQLLAQRYPFIFVDESQDTNEGVIEALKAVDAHMSGRFCLGFFGDPMQKIYATGVGRIEAEPGWVTIAKPENFRCPQAVLTLINNIRSSGDDLVQTRGQMHDINGELEPVQGTARLFILPVDGRRNERLRGVRQWLARENADPHWLNDSKEADIRVLVIVHRMAATRLGFRDLYSAMNDNAPSTFKEDFMEGTGWTIKPFLSYLLPLAKASLDEQHFEVMELLREHCPLLEREKVLNVAAVDLLQRLKQDVGQMVELMNENGSARIYDVLRFVQDRQLAMLDDKFVHYLSDFDEYGTTANELPDDTDEEQSKELQAITAYLKCPAKQLWGYWRYLENDSPYSTQQGIKGTEFARVLTVLDDDEGTHVQFSYNKYLGLAELSDTDHRNLREGKDSVIDRTRRLFYVCCSRAVKDLAVVLFTHDVPSATATVRNLRIFPDDQIHILNDQPEILTDVTH